MTHTNAQDIYAKAIARALKHDRLPSSLQVGTLKLKTHTRIGDVEREGVFTAPLWVTTKTHEQWPTVAKNGRLYLFFKNTTTEQAWATYLLRDTFKKYGFYLTRTGENRMGYYANFETKQKTIKSCTSLLERLRREGILTGVRGDKLLMMHAFAKLGHRGRANLADSRK